MTTKTCAKCGKQGPVAEDETDAGWDEMACDTRGLVARNEYVCGECLERAEDGDTDDEEYTFDLVKGDTRKVVTVDAASYEEAEEAVKGIRDRDFPGHAIEDHMG
jgi:hypothetical protein